MGRYFDEMSAVIERHGGVVEKFIGDAVMAVFGIPRLHEDDALRAVRAAVRDARGARDAQRRARTRSRRRDRSPDRREHRRGRRRRPVGRATTRDRRRRERRRAARAGGRSGRDPDRRGDVPAGARRRRGRAGRAARPQGEGRARPRVSLASPSWPTSRPRAAPRLADGRARQGARDAASERSSAPSASGRRTCSRCSALPASASRGWSKEFLAGPAAEATRPARPVPLLRRGHHVLPARRGGPEAAGVIADATTVDTARAKLAALVADADGARPDRRRSSPASFGWDEPVATEDAFWGVRKLLEHLARERPLVVVFDDIHWAEPTFLDLIEHLADWTRDAAVLLVCVARPELLEVRPGWGGGKMNATSILLEPLAGDDGVAARRQPARAGPRSRPRRAPGSSRPPRATRCSSRRCSGC